jgi:hypothetical protein
LHSGLTREVAILQLEKFQLQPHLAHCIIVWRMLWATFVISSRSLRRERSGRTTCQTCRSQGLTDCTVLVPVCADSLLPPIGYISCLRRVHLFFTDSDLTHFEHHSQNLCLTRVWAHLLDLAFGRTWAPLWMQLWQWHVRSLDTFYNSYRSIHRDVTFK